MPIVVGPQPHSQPHAQAPKPETSTLGQVYRIFGVLALLGAIAVIVFGALNRQIETIIIGGAAILAAILLFGVAEFFNQIARITSATEETARILRERPPA